MTPKERQVIFTKNIGILIAEIYKRGYECTFGEAYRTPLQAWVNALPSGSVLDATLPNQTVESYPDPVGGIGIEKSLHRRRLAIDLNLFKDGAYLTDTESYKQFGMYWLTLHSENRWSEKDANHFSMTDGEIKL